MGIKRVAALDIGSNTVRLMIAEVDGCNITPLFSDGKITRLGEGLHKTGNLSIKAMQRTVAAIKELLAEAEQFKPFAAAAAATFAVRKAENRQQFEELFIKEVPLPLTVIPWQMEAELALKGMNSAIDSSKPLLLFDIGGGSTEFIYRNENGKVTSYGTELGVVRLTEGYISAAPLKPDEFATLSTYLDEQISTVQTALATTGNFTLVGTAGTVTSIASLHIGNALYDPKQINRTTLSAAVVKEVFKKIAPMSLKQRGNLMPLKGGREDLIVAGICIVMAVMRSFKKDSLQVCDAGLREGILFAIADGTIKGSGY